MKNSRLNIVILDACRDNPFKSTFRSTASSCLAAIKAPAGTLIAYATGENETANDNSGYTQALINHMQTP
jgi:uncharacterized caspase-like protein